MHDKILTQNMISGYIFSKYVYCDMQFLVVRVNALHCFLNVLVIDIVFHLILLMFCAFFKRLNFT